MEKKPYNVYGFILILMALLYILSSCKNLTTKKVEETTNQTSFPPTNESLLDDKFSQKIIDNMDEGKNKDFFSQIDPNDFQITITNTGGFASISYSISVNSKLNGVVYANDYLLRNGTIKSKSKDEILNILKNNFPFKLHSSEDRITDWLVIEMDIISKNFSYNVYDLSEEESNIYQEIWKLSNELEPVLSQEDVLKLCTNDTRFIDKGECLMTIAIRMRDHKYCNEEETDYEYSCTQIVKKWVRLNWY